MLGCPTYQGDMKPRLVELCLAVSHGPTGSVQMPLSNCQGIQLNFLLFFSLSFRAWAVFSPSTFPGGYHHGN